MNIYKPEARTGAGVPKFWIPLLGALLLGIAAILFSPKAYRQILETRALDQDSVNVAGEVLSHHVMTGRNKCSSSATVGYFVNGHRYEVETVGCGAEPTTNPSGTQANVWYLRTNPSIARASIADATTQRYGWTILLGIWLAVVVLAFMAYYTATKELGRGGMQNAP